MKLNLSTLATIALLPAALLIAGCASTHKTNETTTVNYEKGVPGGTLVQTYQTIAKVIMLDPVTRQVTLRAPDGTSSTFKAGPEFALDQIKVGEDLNVTVARELVAYLTKNPAPMAPQAATLLRRTPGARPGVLISGTVQFTATVASVDLSKYEATFRISNGRTATFKIRKDVDLAKAKPGMQAIIRTTSAAVVMSR